MKYGLRNTEAIEVIKKNYPPENYSVLREALDMAIEALEWQKRFDDEVYISKDYHDKVYAELQKRYFDLLVPEHTRWIPISEIPNHNTPVLLAVVEHLPYLNKDLVHIVRGCHIEAKKIDASEWEDYDDTTYDEELDTFFVNEGWFELTDFYGDYMYLNISDRITHWMPLPPIPREEKI